MCVKYTFANVLHLILGFIFTLWARYFDFHKLNSSKLFEKKLKFKKFNSKNNEYIYGICMQYNRTCLCFLIALGLGLN
jgi:hypothetical protein